MDNIKFIPKSQSNLVGLNKSNLYNENKIIIITFITMLIIYVIIIVTVYWFFIFKKNNDLDEKISKLDNKNSQYYPKGNNLEQTLFNLNNIILKSYDPTVVIKKIESVYLQNSTISNFAYSKLEKVIIISMIVPSISDVTLQVQKFNSVEGVSKVDFSSTNTLSGSEVSFEVRISLE